MKPFTRIAVVVLWLIALVQLLRFISRWDSGHLERSAHPALAERARGCARRRPRDHGLEGTPAVKTKTPRRIRPSTPNPAFNERQELSP